MKAPDKSLEHSGCVVVPPTSKDPVMFGPNITGTVTGLDYGSGGWIGGAFNALKLYPGTTISSESCVSQSSFMASRSSSVYGNALTVQPPSLRFIPCIKI